MQATIQKRITTFDSDQPIFSKWWCIGAILNTRLPRVLNDTTCMITDSASTTNNPPIIASTISCLHITLTAPKAPPKARLPVSPMNTSAGCALNHKNPRLAPTSAAQKTESSPAPASCCSKE
jgi:hypothetical protein